MEVTILLDQNIAGYADFFVAGLRETGWDQLVHCTFTRLRDFALPDDYPDDELWRFVQARGIWLVTHNRNSTGADSLQATIRRENTLDSLPVITIPNKDKLPDAAYRRRVVDGLVDIIISPEKYRGTGRVFLPQ